MYPSYSASGATPLRWRNCYRFRLLFVLATGCLGCATLQAQPSLPASDEIGFVRLLFTRGGVTVLDVATRPGRLKQRRVPLGASDFVPQGRLVVEAHTAEGALVWTDTMQDPLLERLEYVNEEGELETRFVPHEQAEATLRIPALGRYQRITFFRSEGRGARTATAQVEVVL